MMRNEKGFTFVECCLAIVVVGVGVFGLLNLFSGTVSRAVTTDQAVQASQLARERLEQIVFDKKMKGYDFITSANYPAVEGFTGSFAPFTRLVTLLEVDGADLVTPRPNSGYKRATVQVTWVGGQNVRLETLVTRWNE